MSRFRSEIESAWVLSSLVFEDFGELIGAFTDFTFGNVLMDSFQGNATDFECCNQIAIILLLHIIIIINYLQIIYDMV